MMRFPNIKSATLLSSNEYIEKNNYTIGNGYNRMEFIDIAKGILIIIVILHHFPIYGLMTYNEASFWSLCDSLQYLYTPFFMAAFFVITGYCSNFEIKFKPFFAKNFKTLLWSNFCFCICLHILQSIEFRNFSSMYELLDLNFWFFRSMWFFKALFISKILYWIIKKYLNNIYLKICVILFLFILGVSMYVEDYFPNYFYYRSGLIFTSFIAFGDIAKGKMPINKRITFISCSLYTLSIITLKLTNMNIPFLAALNNLTYSNCVLYVFLAVLGSTAILGISSLIHNAKYLKIVGKYTLVIYPFSTFVMFYFLHKICWYIPTVYTYMQIIMYVVIPLITTIVCCVFYKLFDTKYFKWMLGKF